MHPLAERPTYTRHQLAKYVQRISHSTDPTYILDKLEAEIKADPLEALAELQKKQLAGVPWGNVAMHYSTHRCLSLDADALFVKIVERGLGGYCMENNSFFSNILRSLGYQLYITGARISNTVEMNGKHPDGFGGWEHMIILVTINGRKYHVDVGFGSQGATRPIPLIADTVTQGVPGNEGRLTQRPIAQNTSASQIFWVFETRNVTANIWMPGYCFTELEFLPEDFVMFNFRTHRDPLSWFTYRFVVTRVLLEKGEVVGSVTLMGDGLSRRIGGGASELIETFGREEERVAALKKWFGMSLTDGERRGIVGMVTEIRPPMTGV